MRKFLDEWQIQPERRLADFAVAATMSKLITLVFTCCPQATDFARAADFSRLALLADLSAGRVHEPR